MTRAVKWSKTRAKYDPSEEARKVLSKLDPEVLRNKNKTREAMELAGIKISPQKLGHIKREFLGETNGHSGDLLSNITIVTKTSKRVGGLDNLKNIISVIEKVRSIQ